MTAVEAEVKFRQLGKIRASLLTEDRHSVFTQKSLTQVDVRKPPYNPTHELLNHAVQSPLVSASENVFDLQNFLLTEKPNVRFDKIGGLFDVKETIKLELLYPKIHSKIYSLYGKTPGGGVLLWGPPGCGKTLIGKAIATEVHALFLYPRISDIMSRWLGESEKVVASIFQEIRKYEGDAVAFFDEFDSLVPKNGPSYLQRIKNQFLIELDGLDSTRKRKMGGELLVLAATNKPFQLDSAARRPGRFEKTIFIPPPDLLSRKQIFELALSALYRNHVLNDDVSCGELAEITEGYSGADIRAICDCARDYALFDTLKSGIQRNVTREDLEKAIRKTPRSIIPWINDAIRISRRYGEESYYQELEAMQQFLHLEEKSSG